MGTVCYSITGAGLSYCLFMAQTRRGTAVEIRLDRCFLSDDEIKEVFHRDRHRCPLVATFHKDADHSFEDAVKALGTAIMAGADYVDIDLNWPETTRKWLFSLALNNSCKVIGSYHNYKETDSLEKLIEIGHSAVYMGADIIKIVTTAVKLEDCDTVLALYQHFEPSKLIAFAMGPLGTDSRLFSYSAGAPFYFVAPTRDGRSAPGQPCYFDFALDKDILVKGSPSIPASKSFAERAILLASLTTGTTKLYNFTNCDDIAAAMGVAQAFGAELKVEGDTLTICGRQDIQERGLEVEGDILSVGESGLLARLCIPLAALSKSLVGIMGEGTLNNRKLDDYRGALRKFGIKADFTAKSYLPVIVKGPLRSGEVTITGDKGSQMISGFLLALSQCRGESIIHINKATSIPYLDLTTYVASFFGLDCFEIEDSHDDEDSRTYFISGPHKIKPVQGVEVEKDWSAAAMMMVAGALFGDITLKGMDLFSTQADSMILELMESLHIDIVSDVAAKEVNVRKSIIDPFFYDITDTPDLFAPLFVLALRAEGDSVLKGIHRLANKESNRARTFLDEFRKIGVRAFINGDEMHVYGGENEIYRGGVVCSAHGDHRLAMALAITSLMCRKPLKIVDKECVAKSWPGFFDELKKLIPKK